MRVATSLRHIGLMEKSHFPWTSSRGQVSGYFRFEDVASRRLPSSTCLDPSLLLLLERKDLYPHVV